MSGTLASPLESQEQENHQRHNRESDGPIAGVPKFPTRASETS